MSFENPSHNCNLCPRLASFRAENRLKFPDKFNGPVPSFGSLDAAFLVVGLAPGLRGANFTGRPFTGDWAGDLLYKTLLDFGLAKGTYASHPDDGVELVNTRITNAVRCVPPQNKPIGEEMHNCRPFLINEIKAMKNLKVILCLGKISHDNVMKTLGQKLSTYKFAHNVVHEIGDLKIIDSYHCSRYNTNTGRLTEDMFNDVFANVKSYL